MESLKLSKILQFFYFLLYTVCPSFFIFKPSFCPLSPSLLTSLTFSNNSSSLLWNHYLKILQHQKWNLQNWGKWRENSSHCFLSTGPQPRYILMYTLLCTLPLSYSTLLSPDTPNYKNRPLNPTQFSKSTCLPKCCLDDSTS